MASKKNGGSKKLTAYIYIDKGKLYWEFRDDTETLNLDPVTVKAAKLKFYNGSKGQGSYYWIEKPADKKKVDELLKLFGEHGYEVTAIEPKDEELDLPAVDNKITAKAAVLLNDYEGKASLLELAQKAATEAWETLRVFVAGNGVKTKPGTEDAILVVGDKKVQYQYNEGRPQWNEQFATTWVKKNRPQFIKTVEAIDWDAVSKEEYQDWPVEVRTTYENRAEASYKLCMFDLSKYNCPQCNEYVGRKAKFCPKCGCDLEKAKADK